MKLDKLVRKQIFKIKSYKPGKPIQEVKDKFNIDKVIKLASNENPLGPSRKALKAIFEETSQLHRYPESNCFSLKEKLANHVEVKPRQLIVGNGSDEIVVLTLRAFLTPGEKVIIGSPTFLIYEIQSKISGANVIQVPVRNFRYDLKKMKQVIQPDTKLIFIANPDNPTGTYVNCDEVKEFMDGLPDDLIVYFDEAYYEFAKERSDYPDTLKLIDKKNVIITRSFSKAYGLAGLRIGYGIANEEIIECLNKVREPFNVNRLAQVGAYAALDDQKFLDKSLQIIREGKAYLYKEFERMGLKFIPSSTNFILLDLGRDGVKVADELLTQGVIVRDMKSWKLDNFIRVTIGLPEENKRLIQALEKAIS